MKGRGCEEMDVEVWVRTSCEEMGRLAVASDAKSSDPQESEGDWNEWNVSVCEDSFLTVRR